MTLGDGIFYSTLLLVLAAAIYQISIRHRWRLVGKIVRGLIIIGGVVGAGWWAWNWYQQRPAEIVELSRLRLGMSPGQVLVALGEPTFPEKEERSGDRNWTWLKNDDREGFLWVNFTENNGRAVEEICQWGGGASLLNIKEDTLESVVIDKLGPPAHESVHENGVMKYMSYPQWNTAFRIEKGAVSVHCIFSGERMTYDKEYDDNPFREDTTPPVIFPE